MSELKKWALARLKTWLTQSIVKAKNLLCWPCASIKASITDWTLPAGIELKDYGRLRKDGEIKIQSHDANNAKTKARYIFIFDRVSQKGTEVAFALLTQLPRVWFSAFPKNDLSKTLHCLELYMSGAEA